MLEILFLRWFYKWLGNTAEPKNRTRSWGWLGVIGWFGGEIAGFLMAADTGGSDAYLTALALGALGAGVAAVVVSVLPAIPKDDFPTARVV